MYRILDLFWQCVKWLFIIVQLVVPTNKKGKRPPVLVQTFMDEYVIADDTEVEDSSTYYDFSGLDRKFPAVENLEGSYELSSRACSNIS